MARTPPTPPSPGQFREKALAQADGLYNLARHLVGNEADAEDLVQETFARAFGGWDRFEPGTNLRAWLFRILRNGFLDQVRRERLHPTGREDGVSLETPESDGSEDFLRGDRELESLRHLVGREIESALGELNEESRTVVLLDLEGLSETEIATVLECPPGTVKSRLSRARAALRERLAEYRR